MSSNPGKVAPTRRLRLQMGSHGSPGDIDNFARTYGHFLNVLKIFEARSEIAAGSGNPRQDRRYYSIDCLPRAEHLSSSFSHPLSRRGMRSSALQLEPEQIVEGDADDGLPAALRFGADRCGYLARRGGT